VRRFLEPFVARVWRERLAWLCRGMDVLGATCDVLEFDWPLSPLERALRADPSHRRYDERTGTWRVVDVRGVLVL
jgi:hypothetical protein